MSKYFLYKATYWTNRMKSEDKSIVIDSFLSEMFDAIRACRSDTPEAFYKTLKTIDKEGARVAYYSEHLEFGFKLKKDWVREVMWIVTRANDIDDVHIYKQAGIDLFNRLGWNHLLYESINYTNITTLRDVTFTIDGGEVVTKRIELESCLDVPLGSCWVSKKGTVWEVIEYRVASSSVLCSNEDGKVYSFGTKQVLGMKEVTDV